MPRGAEHDLHRHPSSQPYSRFAWWRCAQQKAFVLGIAAKPLHGPVVALGYGLHPEENDEDGNAYFHDPPRSYRCSTLWYYQVACRLTVLGMVDDGLDIRVDPPSGNILRRADGRMTKSGCICDMHELRLNGRDDP